jgi:hypothetical protein
MKTVIAMAFQCIFYTDVMLTPRVKPAKTLYIAERRAMKYKARPHMRTGFRLLTIKQEL